METWTSRNLLEILKSGRPKPEGPHIVIKSSGYFSKGDILLREASTQEWIQTDKLSSQKSNSTTGVLIMRFVYVG